MTHRPPEIWNDVKYDVYGFAVLCWDLLSEQELVKNGILNYVATAV